MSTRHAHKSNIIMQWQPSASIEKLRQRAALLTSIRAFFAARDVLEIETPTLSAGTVTDVHLDALQSHHALDGQTVPKRLYLQTSPEFAMKRLLAAGFPDIFQICKCFREDEVGRLHNPEFTMLEWYRKGFSMQNLIDEVGQLLMHILNIGPIEQLSYQQVFIHYLQFDPLEISFKALLALAQQKGLGDYAAQLDAQGCDDIQLFDALLQVLFAQEIEPHIAQHVPLCITHFPASQASLAKLEANGETALRFEFYFRGVELANGFEELSDAQLQQARFEQDNQQRHLLGKTIRPIDTRLIDALKAGLPPCAGVALGIDRLVMLALNCRSISEVISFDIQRA